MRLLTLGFSLLGARRTENLAAGTGDAYDIQSAVKNWGDESCECLLSAPRWMTTNGAGDDGNVCTQCADNLGWTLEYSPVQRAEPAAVALYAGRVEGHQAARLCPSGVRGHIPPAIRSESFCFCLWRTERTDWVAECVSSLQNAKFIVCEYFPAGNVIGQFPYVALIPSLVV